MERFLFDDHELTPVIKIQKAGGVRREEKKTTKLTLCDRVSNAGTHLGNLVYFAKCSRKKPRNFNYSTQ